MSVQVVGSVVKPATPCLVSRGAVELMEVVGSNQAPATKKFFPFNNFREPRNHPN